MFKYRGHIQKCMETKKVKPGASEKSIITTNNGVANYINAISKAVASDCCWVVPRLLLKEQ